MPYHTETRKFTIEVEVTATATIETGGGYSDEPEWTGVGHIEIDSVTYNGDRLNMQSYIDAAKEEFSE